MSRLQQISEIKKKKKYCWFSFKTSIVGVFLIFSTRFLSCALICCTFEGSGRVWVRGVLEARVVVFHADRVRPLVTTLSRRRGWVSVTERLVAVLVDDNLLDPNAAGVRAFRKLA